MTLLHAPISTAIPKSGIMKESWPWTKYLSDRDRQLQLQSTRNSMRRSILEFNAVGDSINSPKTDNINAFIDASDWLRNNRGGVLEIPPAPGAFYIGDLWLLDQCNGSDIVGCGQTFDYGGLYQPGSLLFSGAGHGIKVVKSRYLNLRNLAVCGNLATDRLFDIDRLAQSMWSGIYGAYCNVDAFRWLETTGLDVSSYNTFSNISTAVVPVAMNFAHGLGGNGTYLNSFIMSRFGYNGAAAVRFVNVDNLHWSNTYLYRESGSGYGATFEWDGSGFEPNSVYGMGDFQASVGGIHVDVNVNHPGAIYGYDMSNGQPFPTLPANCDFSITTNGYTNVGWFTNILFPGDLSSCTQVNLAIATCVGVPNNALGQNGWEAHRLDGGVGSSIYKRIAGVWVPIA